MKKPAGRKPSLPKFATVPVTSSSIKAIGYDATTKTLRVEFHSGHTYDYPNVSAGDHKVFVNADSIGQHFVAHISRRESRKHPKKA